MRSSTLPLAAWQSDSVLVCAEIGLATDVAGHDRSCNGWTQWHLDERAGEPHAVTNTLTKARMAERLFDELGLNKREAKDIVEMFFEEIRASLSSNARVKLSGFGNFDLRDKRERPGRNPKTGEEIPITARRVVTFRPGQKLKARVEAYAGPPAP